RDFEHSSMVWAVHGGTGLNDPPLTEGSPNMPSPSTLRDAFLDELRDLHNLEKHLIHTLPKLARAATTAALSDAFESHLNETIAHVDRLERVFTGLGERASDSTYENLASVLEQGDEIIADGFDEATTDAMLIAAAQRIEHYEITAY